MFLTHTFLAMGFATAILTAEARPPAPLELSALVLSADISLTEDRVIQMADFSITPLVAEERFEFVLFRLPACR